MKQTYTYIIYAKGEPKRCSGILGEIDLYHIQLLLAGGKYLIEETYDGADPIGWYSEVLREQDIIVKASKQQKYKGQLFCWLEIDSEKTPIAEFTSWQEVPSEDTDTLAWRSIYYPCSPNKKECLGLAVSAREMALQKKQMPLMASDILDALIA